MAHDDPTILVIGGTGVIGSEFLRELDGRASVRALVHSEASAEMVAARHPAFELVHGDLADPSTLPKAFSGTDLVFLLTPSVAEQLRLEENAVAAALDAGVQRIVYVSNAEVGWGIELSRAHAVIERRLAESGVARTALRPDYLFDNLLYDVDELAAGRLVAPTGSARCAFADARDVASVAAAALLADVPLHSPLVVTGPDVLSWTELAERLRDALGIAVEHVDPHPADWQRNVVDAGMSTWLAGALCEYFERLDTEAPATSDDVLRVTGRGPRSIEEFVRDKLAPALSAAGAGPPPTLSVAAAGDATHHFATTPRRREHA